MGRILTYPDELLRVPAKIVPQEMFGTKELKDIIREMKDVLLTEDTGAALAANQIGVSLRIVVVRSGEPYINPEWRPASNLKKTEKEGCLSFPGVNVAVTRYAKIHGSYWNFRGDGLHASIWRDFEARMFQHEVDHLDGKLFIDHLDKVSRDLTSLEYGVNFDV